MTNQDSNLGSIISSLEQLSPSDGHALLKASDALVSSFKTQLQTSQESMLPSFTYRLPDGRESGSAVALDLGGSTLRVAIIRLRPHETIVGSDKDHIGELMSVIKRQSWIVEDDVKQLPAREFFDWITERIASVLNSAGILHGQNMSMGVTWSFPVEPTSAASGRVQKMGKGYTQWKTISGTDLKSHFDASFRRKGLSLRMTALMNDTEATLLSHAYANPATRISLIWGTGINAAVHIPIEAVSVEKLGHRPKRWMRLANAVVVNTEVSMYGAGIFPLSEADVQLDKESSNPGFQPLEQLTSGRYLGEICRLSMLSLINQGDLFEGQMPVGISVPFSFDTASMSMIEEYNSYDDAVRVLESKYKFHSRPSIQDVNAIRAISIAISTRAATYLAITIYSLHRLQQGSTVSVLPTNHSDKSQDVRSPIAVAYCGAVAEKHPTARTKCQQLLDRLVSYDERGTAKRRLVLEAAGDSGLLGAAVGAVLNANELATLSKL